MPSRGPTKVVQIHKIQYEYHKKTKTIRRQQGNPPRFAAANTPTVPAPWLVRVRSPSVFQPKGSRYREEGGLPTEMFHRMLLSGSSTSHQKQTHIEMTYLQPHDQSAPRTDCSIPTCCVGCLARRLGTTDNKTAIIKQARVPLGATGIETPPLLLA